MKPSAFDQVHLPGSLDEGVIRICVFCGSNFGRLPAYAEAAALLGRTLTREGIGLVYGGASVGLMGAVAGAALAADGEAIDVLPQASKDKELAHPGLTALHVVASMHERKAMMADLSDGFIALPGGVGTLEGCSKSGPGLSSASTRSLAASSTSQASTIGSPASSITPPTKPS